MFGKGKEQELVEALRVSKGLLTAQQKKKQEAINNTISTLKYKISNNNTNVIKSFEDITAMLLAQEGILEILTNINSVEAHIKEIVARGSKIDDGTQLSINVLEACHRIDKCNVFGTGINRLTQFKPANNHPTLSKGILTFFKSYQPVVSDVVEKFGNIRAMSGMSQDFFARVLNESAEYRAFAISNEVSPYQAQVTYQGAGGGGGVQPPPYVPPTLPPPGGSPPPPPPGYPTGGGSPDYPQFPPPPSPPMTGDGPNRQQDLDLFQSVRPIY